MYSTLYPSHCLCDMHLTVMASGHTSVKLKARSCNSVKKKQKQKNKGILVIKVEEREKRVHPDSPMWQYPTTSIDELYYRHRPQNGAEHFIDSTKACVSQIDYLGMFAMACSEVIACFRSARFSIVVNYFVKQIYGWLKQYFTTYRFQGSWCDKIERNQMFRYSQTTHLPTSSSCAASALIIPMFPVDGCLWYFLTDNFLIFSHWVNSSFKWPISL